MGCFLGCFGFTKKRKRRKTSTKIISEDGSYGRYVPLDSDVSVKLDIIEMPNPNASATKLKDKPKESSASKIKKKVSFNLNVRSYEPLPSDDYDTYLSEGEEKTIWEFNQEERAETSKLEFEDDSIGSYSYPANYRYQNCRNSYYEEDEIELDESDFDEDNDDDNLDSDEEGEDDGGNEDDKNLNSSASKEGEELVASAELTEERKCKLDQLQDPANQEMNRMESNQSARNRSKNVGSVLNPVENLTQWKAVKAKSRQQSKQQKENIASEQEQSLTSHMNKISGPLSSTNRPNLNHSKAMMHGISIDASLSNWLS